MAYIDPRLQDIVSRGEDLPTLPSIVLELHRALDNPNAGAAHVARLLDQDPSLTSRLLRLVNSARFDHLEFWAHSATVAGLAGSLWSVVGDSSVIGAQDAYLVGLLHDIGLLEAREHDDESLGPLEEEHLGIDHGSLGAVNGAEGEDQLGVVALEIGQGRRFIVPVAPEEQDARSPAGRPCVALTSSIARRRPAADAVASVRTRVMGLSTSYGRPRTVLRICPEFLRTNHPDASASAAEKRWVRERGRRR